MEVRTDVNRFDALRQAEEAEEVATRADSAKLVQDQHHWDGARRLNFLSRVKHKEMLARESLRRAQEHAMEESRQETPGMYQAGS
eukprot:16431495-Heterocapsa_arctica.AAC.1